MEHNNFVEAKKYASSDSQSFLDMISKGNNGEADVYKNQDLDITDNVSINGDGADVEVRSGSGNGVNFHLVKESGGWKVKFNLGALFDMAKDAIKKSGTDVQKEVNQAIDSIKIGLDSIH